MVPRDDPSQAPGEPGDHRVLPSSWARSGPKRALDLVAGVLLTVLTLPVIVILSVGSAVAFRAWPIFTQRRVGRGGRPFVFLKVRSLPVSVPTDIDKYDLREQPSSGWGRFIRGRHLDELPQCWLLLTGRMSLVGPRPEMPSLSDSYDPEFVADRVQVRPGITGPWQIGPDSAGLIGESPHYDLWYVTNARPTLDLWLLWRTLAGLFGARPIGLAEYPARFRTSD